MYPKAVTTTCPGRIPESIGGTGTRATGRWIVHFIHVVPVKFQPTYIGNIRQRTTLCTDTEHQHQQHQAATDSVRLRGSFCLHLHQNAWRLMG